MIISSESHEALHEESRHVSICGDSNTALTKLSLKKTIFSYTQPVGFGRPAYLHACFAGP